jgi:DNA-binding transcriptional ArsR family regulator/protein-L-isoaspartate O-methyltransferase
MLDTFKALADPSRLRLLGVLVHGEFTVQELTRILAMGQSRVSRHLKILTDAGILAVKRQGTWGYYRLGENDAFFREIWPALEKRLENLPEGKGDLTRLFEVLEERRGRSRDFFERYARQWDMLARQVLPVAAYLDPMIEEVPRCEVAVEIGVGTGALLSALSRKAANVVGVDNSPAMIEQALERSRAEGLKGVDLRLGEMGHLPLLDGEAGCVLLNMVLHHAAQPLPVLKEINRVLRPGGTLVIADLQRHEKEWLREKMADQWLGFERRELEGWLETEGFSLRQFRAIDGTGEEQGVFILAAVKGGRGRQGSKNPLAADLRG